METTCKKALCPDRPGEKKIGQATSAPPCERGVPIYPLRYGIADRVLEKKVFPTLSTDGYPALTGGKAYGLRVLRPGTYVYLCYFENGRMWTCSGLMNPDTDLGENGRHEEVSDEQATTYVFPGVQTASRLSGA
ncbi:hypothetical protein LGN31_14860, partial [Burkholderia cepacia]